MNLSNMTQFVIWLYYLDCRLYWMFQCPGWCIWSWRTCRGSLAPHQSSVRYNTWRLQQSDCCVPYNNFLETLTGMNVNARYTKSRTDPLRATLNSVWLCKPRTRSLSSFKKLFGPSVIGLSTCKVQVLGRMGYKVKYSG